MHQSPLHGFQFPSQDELVVLNPDRHAALRPEYESYCQNPPPAEKAVTLPTLELVPASDISVIILDGCGSNDDAVKFMVTRESDPHAVNFMGYHQGENCLAFRGETRLFKDFLEFASATVNVNAIKGSFQNTAIRYPASGLESGLNYKAFAARVEIIEYALVITHPTVEAAGSAIDDEPEVGWSLPHNSTSLRSFPPTPGIKYKLSDLLDLDPNFPTPKFDKFGPKSGYDTPSRDSDGSLSPPPEVVVTPPSMKRYAFRDKVGPVDYSCDTSSEDEEQSEKEDVDKDKNEDDAFRLMPPPRTLRSRENR